MSKNKYKLFLGISHKIFNKLDIELPVFGSTPSHLFFDSGATSAVKEKEKFEKEKARLQGELDAVRLRLSNALNYQEELEQRNSAAEETIAKLEEQLEVSRLHNIPFVIHLSQYR